MAIAPEKLAFRRDRLKEAVALLGAEDALGERLGWKNGAFIRQMVNGLRVVSEKTIAKIEALPDMAGWFQSFDDDPLELTPEERAMVITFRERLKRQVGLSPGYAKINQSVSATGKRSKGK